MTPENDKTLRGLFLLHKPGYDEWNDRRHYRRKYEESSVNVSDRRNIGIFEIMIADFVKVDTLFHDNVDVYSDESQSTDRLFPETKKAIRFNQEQSYGYNTFGEYCECCGKVITALDLAKKYGICDDCDHNLTYERRDGERNILGTV